MIYPNISDANFIFPNMNNQNREENMNNNRSNNNNANMRSNENMTQNRFIQNDGTLSNTENPSSLSKDELLNKIRQANFAVIDLNLFLDTHPNDQQALNMFKSLVFTLNALKNEYQRRFGPLRATASSDAAPFEWVDEKYKWPWQKKEE